jgi:hypothetical protein
MPSYKHSHYPAYLKTGGGRQAFLELSNRVCREHSGAAFEGCPATAIELHMQLITGRYTIPDTTQPAEEDDGGDLIFPEQEVQRCHPLDSYVTALEDFTPRRLRKLENTVHSVLDDIAKLSRTPLVLRLQTLGAFGDRDLLRHPHFSRYSAGPFQGVLQVRAKAKEILGDPRRPKRPGYDRSLALLYKTIRYKTGHWHDRLVADLLNDVMQTRVVITEDSLRKWRHDHKSLLIGALIEKRS